MNNKMAANLEFYNEEGESREKSNGKGSCLNNHDRIDRDVPMKDTDEDDLESRGENLSVSELIRCKARMNQTKLEYEAELMSQRLQQSKELEPTSFAPTDSCTTDLYERLSDLEKQLFSVSSSRSYKTLVINRLLMGDLIIKKLFPDTVSDTPTQRQIEEMHSIAASCNRQNKLCMEILENHKILSKEQETLEKIKRQNFEIKKSNREAMARLQELKKEKEQAVAESSSDEKTLRRAKEQLSDEVAKIDMVRNIFQGLVLGSGINWAAYDKLRSVVLSLGEPLDFS